MDLHQKDKLFVVCGATSGFGLATAEALLAEGARVIAVARGAEKLTALAARFPEQIEPLTGDITDSQTIAAVVEAVAGRPLAGLLVNAGGPPAKKFEETTLDDWDAAYRSLVRWKVELTQALLPNFKAQRYGRVVFVESSAVKQPISHLALSTSLRLAVVGFVKVLSQDLLPEGVTLNVMAPGYHRTPAVERLFVRAAQEKGTSVDEEMALFESQMRIGRMGRTEDFGALAAWLLSEKSGYVTGQTIGVDGGVIQYTMG